MRRIAFVLVPFVLVFWLAACAPAAPAPAAVVEATATEAPATEEVAATEAVTSTETTTTTETTTATVETAATGETVELPEVNPLEVTGDIIVAGSSTVYPLSEAIAERFTDEGYAGNITIDSIGSGAGLERFCVAGETDIANASRGINEEEIANCATIGRTPIEFRVGTDALAVVVNPANDWATDVTLEQLAQIFTAVNWSDVDPSWPAEPIQRFIPGTDSGTFDYFVEEVLEDNAEPLLAAPSTQLSEDDNVLVQGVEGSEYAIGFFGYAYYQENADLLNILNIDGVEPTYESVEGGEYALARPLFIYSDATIIQEKPQVGAFINFFLTHVNEVIEEVGYFPASEEALNAAKGALSAVLP
ncbi:MAG: PstS family phosphate ABC transporter substrate-binding protein [Caldilineaceae bacterium]|nr:PstS family phosphate ABC transporter substrate-binding protein [Caldilineaceae bacterium]